MYKAMRIIKNIVKYIAIISLAVVFMFAAIFGMILMGIK